MNITAEQLMSRVNDLVPIVAERAQKTEENRAPLDETITDLIDSGILSTLTPKAYGGLELGDSRRTSCAPSAQPARRRGGSRPSTSGRRGA